MVTYIIRRLINVLVVLLVVSMVTFVIFFMVPSLTGRDPALLYIGKQADAVAIEGIRHKMGFDKPIVVQYALFVKGIFMGRDYQNGPDVTHCPAPCLGYSFKTEQPVWGVLMQDLPVTLGLALGAALIWLVVGIGSGIVSALRRGTAVDRAVMVTALGGVSLPIYFTGDIALLVFVHKAHWLPDVNIGITPASDFGEWFLMMLLPWTTLAFLFAATYARLVRANMLETLGEDYIRTARAKGAKESRVVGRHALRAGLTPVVTVFGLDFGLLVGGAVLTENTFNLRGLGYQALLAIRGNDLPMILGVTLFAAFFVVVANLIVDIVYGVIDPRVRVA